MPSIKAGAWRLVVIPGDHEPRHVHARHGTRNAPAAVIRLEANGTVTLREADPGLSRAEIRVARGLVLEHFDKLAALWEEFHR
jgi:Domain of unknown function (DUF4160)